MKVLFVVSTLRAGGAERVCALLASKFSLEHESVLVKFDKDEPFYELHENVKLINLNQGVDELGILGNIKKRLGKIFSLRRIVKEGKFDVVISFLDTTNLLVLSSTLGLKTPVIISEHTSFDKLSSKTIKTLKRILYPRASALSVLTKADAKLYAKYCKIVNVIHNPLFIKPNLSNTKKENLVIFVGRLVGLKNCEMFIEVAKNLNSSGYKFIVAGDGNERKRLEDLSNKLGADVKFLGNVTNIGELYAKAKFILSTSKVEGLGNTLIEAVAFDCVRIATKTSGACELITNGYNGILCEISNSKAMSESLKSLMNDEQEQRRLATNARLGLNEFSLENIYERWLYLLKMAGVKIQGA
ncbi:glycosyltransferase [Campylobacter sp. RM9344]|uniref:Glycosyltransferase n=1 Tax=Campylobacter californiensis TaxID=1032243 RepID=A0AAW3ZTZ4_9BACT|nr:MULTISPECIES: glycosyltransferase [unclassified Campylobacter]MBE2985234.1 glycosyltransferase [Campylobacter sp. RM6883]MBE2986885.1 glycosyltransferase [Campylobacter sp. RM12919]MBE2988556.1 glycosyltransferase [Campylobacter sp. RM12920]MBE2995680.1 glycosyltransferase [Campylobacter sp. RM6913]MBE3029745.1 glycosyltransferase [Campylobacter sp. RM9344]